MLYSTRTHLRYTILPIAVVKRPWRAWTLRTLVIAWTAVLVAALVAALDLARGRGGRNLYRGVSELKRRPVGLRAWPLVVVTLCYSLACLWAPCLATMQYRGERQGIKGEKK